FLHCVVRDADPAIVGRAFSAHAVEIGLGSYPGFHLTAPPGDASPVGVYHPGYIPVEAVDHVALFHDGSRIPIAPAPETRHVAPDAEATPDSLPHPLRYRLTRRAPLGRVVGARSGDKGGDANLGVWARDDPSWRWLAHTLTVAELQRLLPETASFPVRRHVFANLRALNFVIVGLLGEGVASSTRFDPQAKALGEWLRSRTIDTPEELL
ncbi:MAG: exopolyphosphatase, partial [Candidatus Dormiibacterota bacterium]